MWWDKLIVFMIILAAPVIMISSCDRPDNYIPRYPESSVTTPPVTSPNPEQKDPCAQACKRLIELGCQAGKPTDGGSSCYDVCFHVENSGVARFCPVAISKIKSCQEAETAFRSCDNRAR